MMTTVVGSRSYLDALDEVIENVIAPDARDVDETARFPRGSMDALAEAGLLGLVSAEEIGGAGGGLPDATIVVERVARACASSAMVVCMHYAATAVLEAHGPSNVRAAIARGEHVSTLAFSEAGSYVWSSLSTTGDPEGGNTLWLVPADAGGLTITAPFDGLGMRGNCSAPVVGVDVSVDSGAMVGSDGGGFDIMMSIVLPWFQLMNAAVSLGTMEGALSGAIAHVSGTRLEHVGQSLADLPTIRAYLARARIKTDSVHALLNDTLDAAATGRDDASLRVLEVKAAAAEAALEVTDTAMRVCGGAAFRKEAGIERYFRDARAMSVMDPRPTS